MKNRGLQPITKQDLDEAMEHFALIVRDGFEEQEKFFDAKLDAKLNEKIAASEQKLLQTMEGMRTEIRTEMHTAIAASEHRLLDSNAAIAKEISDMRAEQAAILGGRQRIDNTLLAYGEALGNHENRITKLEVGGVEN